MPFDRQPQLKGAFQFVRSVVFIIGLNNLRSQKAVEKIGGVRVANRTTENGRESAAYVIARPGRLPPRAADGVSDRMAGSCPAGAVSRVSRPSRCGTAGSRR
jgi:hypothetical protein